MPRDLAGIRRLGARDAGDGDKINKPRCVLDDTRQTFIIGCRRGQVDEVQTRGNGRQAELALFFRRQVNDDKPIDAGFLGVDQKRLGAVDINGIVIPHQHDRRVVVFDPEGAHCIQGFGQGHAGLDGAQ